MKLAWLHLSDWHEGRPDFDREIVRSALLNRVEQRAAIDPDLKNIDFVAFSGDIANTGADVEYQAFEEKLLRPLAKSLGLASQKKGRFLFVPGNHDLDRSKVSEIPSQWMKDFYNEDDGASRKAVNEILSDVNKRTFFLNPFASYARLVDRWSTATYKARFEPAFYSIHSITKDNYRVIVVCLNSALLCSRQRSESGNFWDHGFLKMAEVQLESAFRNLPPSDLVLCMVHHPPSWLSEGEQARFEEYVGHHCHLVLHGHEHRQRVTATNGSHHDLIMIPAGATYGRRLPADPRYNNSFNFVVVDTESGEGRVIVQQWSDEDKDRWINHQRLGANGSSRFFLPNLRVKRNGRRREYLHILEANFRRFFEKRLCSAMEITLSLKTNSTLGKDFIMIDAHWLIDVEAGLEEEYAFINRVESFVWKVYMEGNLKQKPYECKWIRSNGKAGEVIDDQNGKYTAKIRMDANNNRVDCRYSFICSSHAFFQYSLPRFCRELRLTIVPDSKLAIDFEGTAGFPVGEIKRNEVAPIYELRSRQPFVPHQGFTVFWERRGGAIDHKDKLDTLDGSEATG